MTAPQSIDIDALRKLRKLCEAAPAHGINYAEHYNAGGFYDAARNALPIILDEVDRLRTAEAAGKARNDANRDLMGRLIQEAQIWSMEARRHKSTVHEAYQAVTGATGEPGNWNGARPIVDALKKLRTELDAARAEIARLTDAGAEKVEFSARVERLCRAMAKCEDRDPDQVTAPGCFMWQRYAGEAEKEISKALHVLGLGEPVAPPPPAATDRGVPGQVTDAMIEAFGKAHYEDQWETFKFGLGDVTVCNRIRAGICAALATAPKAEDVRRETIEEAASLAENSCGRAGALIAEAIRSLLHPEPAL